MVTLPTDLTAEPITASPETLATIAALDETIISHRRDIDPTWFSTDRQGYLYRRQGRPVGYGYMGLKNGPFALLDNADFPAVLAHAESQAAAQGRHEFGLEAPMVNQMVVDYLLGCGYKLDSFMAMLMSDAPFGKFENYILTSPPFFM